MSCNHTREQQVWVEREDCDGYMEGEWEWQTEYTIEDIDLHRYRCTQCGETMYYSSAAREYYETGVDRKGLFGK